LKWKKNEKLNKIKTYDNEKQAEKLNTFKNDLVVNQQRIEEIKDKTTSLDVEKQINKEGIQDFNGIKEIKKTSLEEDKKINKKRAEDFQDTLVIEKFEYQKNLQKEEKMTTFQKDKIENQKIQTFVNDILENQKRSEEFIPKMAVPNRFSVKYVKDVTVQDGVTILTGQKFVKIWEVINIGDMHWPEECYIRYLSGADEYFDKTSKTLLESLEVGKNGEVKIEITAPTKEGYYKIYFQIHTKEGTPFGDRLFIILNTKNISLDDIDLVEEKKKYEKHLEILGCLGFKNEEILIMLLKKNNGNVKLVVEEYKLYSIKN